MEEKAQNSINTISPEIIISYPLNRKSFNAINKIKQLIPYLGPAFIISVAYIDPGKSLYGMVFRLIHVGQTQHYDSGFINR